MSRNPQSMIPKRIGSIGFTLMDPQEIRRMSSVEVKTADTYRDDGRAFKQGLMDPRMGVIEPNMICPTDNCKYDTSPGHFGHILLELPVIHIGFINNIKTALKSSCNTCGRALLHGKKETHPSNPALSEQDYWRDRVSDIMLKHGVGSSEFTKVIKMIEKVCSGKKASICMHCQSEQGKIMIDKPSTFKERFETKTGAKSERKLNPRDIREWLTRIPNDDLIFIGMDKANRPEWTVLRVLPVPPITVRPSITLDSGDRSEDDLTHKLVDVLRINQRLRENRDSGAPQLIVEDLWELLQYHITTYFDNQTSGIPPARHRSGRPLKTLTQRLKGKEGRFRSNLSGKRVNFCARSVISPDPYLGINEVGVPEKVAMELSVPIRVNSRNREQMRQMILRGPNKHPGVNYVVRPDGRRVRITDRSKFINSGFRCLNPDCLPENSMRPDLNAAMFAPNFLPGLVVKEHKTKNLDGSVDETFIVDLEKTLLNLEGIDIHGKPLKDDNPEGILQQRWIWEREHGLGVAHPDHHEIECPHCGSPINEYDERTRLFDRLETIDSDGNPKEGNVVERHLIDGDVSIFNRQPSLHRMSMMVHEVRVMKGHTFRFNLAVCTPYNADYDGDEMNLHVIQGEEARAEAKILMRVQEHILSPRYGGAVIGGIHDHISGAFMLSREGIGVRRSHALQILSSIKWVGELPKEIDMCSKKGTIIDAAAKKGFKGELIKGFRGHDLIGLLIPKNIKIQFTSRSMDTVEVNDGKVSGTLDKRSIGAEDGRLLDAIVQTNGSEVGAKFLDDFTRLSIAACTSLGFTTGIDDEDLPDEALAMINSENAKASDEVEGYLTKFGKTGKGYEVRPGRTPIETLEEDIMIALDQGKQRAGDIAKEELLKAGENNSAVNMAISGARGSMDNLTMMAASIGQAKVRGKRLERGYKDRVLSHFPRGSRGAQAKGFVASSFKHGLEPTEFFMLSVSGRESLVDTAVRTSKSGYMQRRLINAMDDLKVVPDSKRSVRNTADRIIQFSYGEDGIDPCRSAHGSPVNIDVIVDTVLGTFGELTNIESYKDHDDKDFESLLDDGFDIETNTEGDF